MSQPGYPPTAGTGERWAVNMPAVIGVVFVFLVGVIVWVVASSGDDPEADAANPAPATAAPAALVTTTVAVDTSPPATTSPAPLPATTLATTVVSTTPPTSDASTTTVDTTVPPTTTPETTSPDTTAPPTTAAPTTAAPTTTVDLGSRPSGDLGIAGIAISRPPCDDAFITVIGSSIGDQTTADGLSSFMAGYPGSNYLRTDLTCPSLNPSVNGQPIYVVYFGPYASASDACAARSSGTSGSYVRQLSNSLAPDHSVDCN